MAKLIKGFEAPTPRRLLSEGEVKEPPKELPPPPKPPEYFPGYQKQVSTFSGMAETATKRLESAQKQMTELQSQWGLRMFWDVPARGTISFPVFPFVQMQFTSEEEFNRQRQIAQAELDSATREYSRMSWRAAVLASMPYLLADTEGSVRTLDDILTEMPNDFLLEGDRQWLQETYDKLSHLVPTELPEGFTGDSLQAREQLLNTVLAEPKAEFKAVHNMTVDELMRSVQPITAELPTGMSNDDVRSLLTDLEFDEETQADILGIHNVAQELATEWKIQSAHINLVRQGLLEAEAPDLTPMEFTKMLFTQPALATLELLDKYFNMLPRPLAAKAIIDFPRIRKDSDAAQLEELYENYRAEGVGYWEAYSKAFQDWGENTWLKMYIETAFDPTSYIGLGIATKVAKPIPYLGRFVGAVERGWCELWDVPFRGLRNMIKAIPKTPTQHALSYARQAFMDTRAYLLSRYTGRDLTSITAPEVKEAMENAIQQAMERPYETGDLSVRVGKYLTDYDFIEEAATREWVNLAGGEGAQVTGQMVHDTNMQFDLFFRKSLTAPEAASNILASVGVEATEKNIGKMAKALQRHSEKILGTSLDVVKGENARDILPGLLRNVEDMQVRKAMSPVYQYALKTGRATSWLGRAVDSVTRNGILAKIDRMVTAPMANQYLLFTNYGPFNILENSIRSFLGGGELLYPRAASPVDELVRIGEGITSLPYEFVTFQREMGRLEIAVIDPKTNKTMVFSKGKIPGMTKELPFGLKINIGGKDYPIRSWQNWNDMFGDIGTKQRAHYLLTKYKQFLAEIAPDQIDQIADVFGKHQAELDAIESIGKGDRADLVRVLEQDATVGPDMIRKHDIPLPELERRRALRQINKTLDKMTDIYSPHKQTIRDGVLDGTIWKDIDGSMDAVAQSIREFNVATLQAETAALDRLVADLAKFAPADGDELLRTMGFVSDIVDGITERISEVRSITRSRAAKLLPGEKDNFYRASTDTLAEFLGKSNEAVEQMLDGVKANLTRPRTLLDDITRDIKLGGELKPATASDMPLILDGEEIGRVNMSYFEGRNELMINLLEVTKSGVLGRDLMKDIEVLIHDLASSKGLGEVSVAAKPQHRMMYEMSGYKSTPLGYVKPTMKPKPSIKLTEQQTSRLGALSDAIKLRHAGAISARDLDRRIINDAISATPRKQRTAEWWDWLENKRSTEAWEPYWAREEDLFNQVEDLKLGMMQDLGVDITDVPTPPQVDQLTPAHVAYLMGTTGDDLNKALTRVGAMVTVRPKNRFVTLVYRRANKAATKVNKTAEEIGFSREAIGDVYDQMFTQAGIDPKFVANEPLTPTMLQMEELRQELHRIKGLKAMPESDYVKFKGYLNGVADDLEELSMYTPNSGWTDMREEAMMKARTQYELDFTDYDNRNMVDAAMRMIYPFWSISEDTEVMTRRGWKHYWELDKVDELLSLDKDTMLTHWDGLQYVNVYDYDGEAIHIKDRSSDFLCTPNHWWLVKKERKNSFDFVRAEKLSPRMAFPKAAKHDFSDYSMLTPDEASLVGWLVTDGTIKQYSMIIGQSNSKSKNVDIIRRLLTRNGWLYREWTEECYNGTYMHLFRLNAVAKNFINSIFPAYTLVDIVSQLDEESAEAMWQAMWKAEGCERTGCFVQLGNIVLDAFEMLTFLTGRFGTRGLHDSKRERPTWQFYVHKSRQFHNTARKFNRVPYHGKMWCPRVEHRTILIRRNNKVYWTGNTYEWQRWFWLPRAMLRTPGVGTGIGRYQNYSDSGYIPMPGTDIQFNPLRGTVFMGGFRRLMLRDYPEYYDAFPGMEAIDYISRMGFYPGIHVMLPIVMTGAATGKPEWGEIVPSWAKTGLNAARTVSPELAGKAIDHIFPDRFRDYLTMLTLGEEGYDADEIWRKKKSGKPISEDEEKLWLKAEARATGLKGILFEQSGVFRIRPPEYTEFMETTSELIEDMTGVPASVQEAIRNRYPVTGKRLSDYYKLDTLQQKVLYEREQYRRWQGVTEPLYPSTWQQEDIRVRDYFEGVESIYDDYRNVGVFDEQGNMLSPSVNELTEQWMSGTIGPDQWRGGRASILEQASAATRELGLREYPDVPKTLDERTARLEERGIPAPTLSPDQELMYMYFDLKPEMKYNWESGKDELDYDTYFSKIDALIDTLEGEFKQRLIDRIQYSWNSVEKLYWDVSREYLRPYRLVRSLVLEQYTPEQRQQILRFEVARGAEREELKEIIGPGGTKLISGFSQGVREARLRLRYLDPTLDAWCYFFGITDKLVTNQSEVEYDKLSKRYLTTSMAK